MDNERKIYEVWGLDTFACEVYFCGSYDNRAEAEARLRELESKRDNEGTDNSVADRYQLLEKTPETVNNRPRCRFRVPLVGWVTDED